MEVRQFQPGDEPDRPLFLFDFASPSCWLVAERILAVMPVATEWVPVLGGALGGPVEGEVFRCEHDELIWREELERRAVAAGVQPVRWPPAVPFDSAFAMRAATYAKSIGRAVAFSLAAFRQAWCGGRDLEQPESVLIAAAACEMHPSAVLKGAGLRSTAAALERATADARERGADRVPAIVAGGRVWTGADAPEQAAAALAPA